ncbi:hypothetical protein LTR99_000879 [Exophiala xenobiotica]|uniref:Heterokaryon incompatibility domain-containing protein n=1 Tax=Vermiconidia calcicola TaxID=1690605 RepID=A0AAV9QN75_9PEZI|nr:hypothetical protein LTR96_000466 [Exophiala xenobiotica]KAK5540777.1 hypothetical protein LTR23_006008 [Chaetothyriales sp. CCFEE 6169]KAK5545442.1 hypothetical protein LTR25_000449 [Vermiconidia calcicola]KAK5307907.1 hypothetical protein LTR99_000879 [Exophiala xenobiotica]KAK5343196.1 hypothetical protein LTR98_000825 [Exophiala xenobiotica]
MDLEPEPQPYFEPDSQPHFRHKPLPGAGDAIRLLRLQPGGEDEPLQGSLEIHTLDNKPQYDALSYMWANKEPKRVLHVDSQRFLLRPNIYSFLLRLRLPDKPRMVWLDSVCINQNSVDERSQQVSLMRDIYSSCQECQAWLGESDEHRGDEVIEVLKKSPADTQGMLDLNYLVRQLYHRQLTEAFKRWLAHPYWGRIWMLQELTLPRKVTVHCGGSNCPLDLVPTQLRARMFELFQSDRLSYQQWLRVFKPTQETSQLVKTSVPDDSRLRAQQSGSSNNELVEMFPCLVGYLDPLQQAGCYLGFVKASGKARWEAVVVEEMNRAQVGIEGHHRASTSNLGLSILGRVSLSSVSGLSFSTTDFEPEAAFYAIEAVFWCINNTRSEQLLEERRRYSTASNRPFSSNDFRNFLETADRWHCTDIRDRIFGVLGVFEVWPQSYPFRADYRLSEVDLLVGVVDYCRPTDPFKLAIRLLSALGVELSNPRNMLFAKTNPSGPDTVTIMSRIAWPLSLFHNDAASGQLAVSGDYRAVWLRRKDTPSSVVASLYFSPHGDGHRQTDQIASIGDAGIVVGIRESVDTAAVVTSYECVGIGFDISFELPISVDSRERNGIEVAAGMSDFVVLPEETFGDVSLAQWLRQLPEITVHKAPAEDKGDDGTPVLWWIKAPRELFWYICRWEERRRSRAGTDDGGEEENDSLETTDGLGGESYSRGLSSVRSE